MKNIFVLVVVCLVLIACGVPPVPRTIVNSFPIDKPFDSVWTAVIEVFAELSLPILNMEKASGLITTDSISFRGQKDQTGYCACGSARFPLYEIDRQGKFNVFVKKTSVDSIELQVNAVFEKVAQFETTIERTPCVSTGKLEAEIYRRVSEKIK
jgi:hypothetical protein